MGLVTQPFTVVYAAGDFDATFFGDGSEYCLFCASSCARQAHTPGHDRSLFVPSSKERPKLKRGKEKTKKSQDDEMERAWQ